MSTNSVCANSIGLGAQIRDHAPAAFEPRHGTKGVRLDAAAGIPVAPQPDRRGTDLLSVGKERHVLDGGAAAFAVVGDEETDRSGDIAVRLPVR